MIEVSRDNLFSVIVSREEAQFICTLMPFAVPHHEVEKLFPFHSLSPEAELEMGRHQAFLIVAGNGFELEKKREACLAFNRLCGAVMRLEPAVGMYMGGAGLLLEKETYLRHVEIIKSPVGEDRDYFSAPLWIRVLLYLDDGKKIPPMDLQILVIRMSVFLIPIRSRRRYTSSCISWQSRRSPAEVSTVV